MILGTFGEKFVEAAKNVKDSCMRLAMRDVENMDHDTLDAMQATLKFLEATNALVEQQTKTIDEMNRKLDKLLEK